MLYEDFYGLDGEGLEWVLAKICDWIIEHKPINPVLVPMEQDSSFIKFRLYMRDYE